MSVLGPISTLQPARPATYLDLDFSSGEVPQELVYSRASNHGVWDKDGKYSVVGPDVPPITWVPELHSYALALEPASRNLLIVDQAKPIGLSFGSAPFVGGLTAPDGTQSAVKIGSGDAATAPYTHFTAGSSFLSITLHVLKGSTIGSGLFIGFRNGTTLSSFGTHFFDSSLGTFSGIASTGLERSASLKGDWWVVNYTLDNSRVSAGDSMGMYVGRGASAGSLTPATLWYGQVEDSPFATSLIIPGASHQARVRALAYANFQDVLDGISAFVDYAAPSWVGDAPSGRVTVGAGLNNQGRVWSLIAETTRERVLLRAGEGTQDLTYRTSLTRGGYPGLRRYRAMGVSRDEFVAAAINGTGSSGASNYSSHNFPCRLLELSGANTTTACTYVKTAKVLPANATLADLQRWTNL